MAEHVDANALELIAAFLRGLDELAANTGVNVLAGTSCLMDEDGPSFQVWITDGVSEARFE